MSNNPDCAIGYWASQEQYSMHDLLKFVTEAEWGGFKTCLTSDHFHPWWHDNGYGDFKSGFTRVYMHSTSPDEIKFIRDFCAKVLPYFNDRKSA